MKRHLAGCLLGLSLAGLAIPADGADPLANVVLFATNSVRVDRDALVSGDLVVNEASPGPTLTSGFELSLDQGAAIAGGVAADSVKRSSSATISGTVSCNNGSGVSCSGLALPVIPSPPTFVEAFPRPGSADVLVNAGQTATLAADDYGDLTLGNGATLIFSGGLYQLGSISAAAGSSLRFAAPSEVRMTGRLALGKSSFAGPAAGSGIGAADIVLYVGGENGLDGQLASLPAAVAVGQGSELRLNLYAPRGAARFDKSLVFRGAVLARDIQVDRTATLVADNAFRNQPPVAVGQVVATAGAAALDLVLTAVDPEHADLTFAIVSGPSHGSLGPLTPIVPDPVIDPVTGETRQPPIVSAAVTYFPDTPGAMPPPTDSFTFQAVDPCGAFGVAVVQIDPPGEPPNPGGDVETVVALDGSAETAVEKAVVVSLFALAPCDGACDGVGDDVPLTFSLLGSPSSGSLSGLTQGGEVPRRSATVTYTPDEDFAGTDTFGFQACGVLGEQEVCDGGTVAVTVAGELANDQMVATPQDTPVEITLTGTPGAGTRRLVRTVLGGRAAFLQGAAIAGNTADADGDGVGDNHNALPGSAPVLMAAAVDATGGPGSNGVVRMQIEWDLTSFAGLAAELVSSEVLLHTQVGSVDSLDTTFFAGTAPNPNADGLLTDADFATPAIPIAGVVMPVPDVPAGTAGLFSFDVTGLVRGVLSGDGQGVFVIQGRVDESLAGQGFQRGLQVHTSAAGNLASGLEPQLSLTTPGVTPPPLELSITVLPLHGILLDAQGLAISTVPTVLSNPRVTYQPAAGFSGFDSFVFRANDFLNEALGTISITVVGSVIDPCVANGRPPGCAPLG